MNRNNLSNAYESTLNKKQEKKKLAGTFWIGSKHFRMSKDCLL